MTAAANARHAKAVSRRRFIALPFRSGGACSSTDPIGIHEVGAPIRRQRPPGRLGSINVEDEPETGEYL